MNAQEPYHDIRCPNYRKGKTMTQTATAKQANHPQIQRVFQSKAETKAFYDKISHVYDLLAEHSEGPMRRAGLDTRGDCARSERLIQSKEILLGQ
jgi:hypothetical protein